MTVRCARKTVGEYQLDERSASSMIQLEKGLLFRFNRASRRLCASSAR
jgi:hypothetical protein